MDRFEEIQQSWKKSRKKGKKIELCFKKNQINNKNTLTELREKFDSLIAENEDIKKQVKHELLSHALYSKMFNYII